MIASCKQNRERFFLEAYELEYHFRMKEHTHKQPVRAGLQRAACGV